MKVPSNKLLASIDFLNKINTSELPISLAIKLADTIDTINKTLITIEGLRKKIASDGVQKDSEGNPVYVDEEKQYVRLTEEASKKMQELLSIERDVEIEPLLIKELEANSIKITPADVNNVRWLLK